ncbi:MAG: restriction endonuclease [Methanomicrobiales archaeon]|nr:restriction endonuclease [Methanomicrobiales archaeon]
MTLQEWCSISRLSKKPHHAYQAFTEDFETIGSIASLEAVAEGSPWQSFERLAAFIFEKHGYQVSVGSVLTKNRKRRQYDVIARKNGRTILVECKQWAGNRYRLSALKQAIVKHRERSEFFQSVMGEDGVPVIVVLIEEQIRVFEGVPLVPVCRLDAFIGELEHGADGFSFAEYETGYGMDDGEDEGNSGAEGQY